MNIKHVDISNKEEIKNLSKLIYDVFNKINKKESDNDLILKYEKLYWEWYDYNNILKHFEKWKDIFLIAIEEWNIVWIIRWSFNKIINLYVDPKQQWKWIWKILILEFEKIAKKNWTKEIILKPSKQAKNFYKYMWYKDKDHIYMYKKI
jgi:GNAT superfamily N-acetyltransferase